MNRDEVINSLRACLISSQDPIPESAISRDYRSLVGTPIPYQRLGYQSLRAFLASESSFLITKSRDGQYLVSAKPDEDTGHISLMVARQKRRSKRGVRVRNRNPNPRFSRPSNSIGSRSPSLLSLRLRSTLLPTPKNTPRAAPAPAAPPARSSSGFGARLGNPPVIPQRQWAPEPGEAVPRKSSAPTAQTRETERKVEEGQGRCLNVTVQNYSEASTASRSGKPPKDATLGCRVQSSVMKPKMAVESSSSKGKFQRELASLSAQLNFPEPIYRSNSRRPTRSTPQWCATVFIGDASFNTFPDESTNEEDARELAAEKACIDFRKRIELLQGTLERHSPMQEALKRIEEMVNSKPNGIFSDHVEAEYVEKYGQRLPPLWREEGAANLCFEIDSMAGNRFILYPVPQEKRDALILNNNIQMVNESQLNNVQRNGRTSPVVPQPKATPLSNESPPKSYCVVDSMSKLDLPPEDAWDVYVTSASSPGQVWVRLVGDSYDVMYDIVLTEMELHMMDKKREAPKPVVLNGYYSVYLDKCWLRAQVTEILKSENPAEEDSVDIFLIDNGEIDTVPISSLYVLEPQFAVLPAQAIRCRLALAEVLGENTSMLPLLLDQVGRSFVAEVVERGNENEDHAIILFDTSVDPPIDINAKLLNEAFGNLSPPKLPAKGGVTEMMLGCVSVNGPVYVTVYANAFKWVLQILEDLVACDRIVMNDDTRPKPSHLRNPRVNCMVLAKSKDSPDQWRRATIVQAADDLRTVSLCFVDYGNVETVPTPEILLLDQVCPVLCKVPKQSIKVELHGIPSHKISSQVASHIRELAPVDKPLLGRVVDSGNGDQLPVLSLFFRVPPNNILASINDNVLLSIETAELKLDPKTERGDSRTEYNSVRADSRNGRSESRNERSESRNGRPDSRSGRVETRSSSRNGSVDSEKEKMDSVYGVFELTCEKPVDGLARVEDKVAPVLCRGLSAPYIPEVGKGFFQVYVPIASNPDLFVVQPINSFKDRQEMMKQLQDLCNSNTLLPPTVIEERNLYAARNKDKVWYRVSVVRRDKDVYTVYMCDFGAMAIISAKNFLCLEETFRKLPYQAIRAKLTGIKPVNVNWSSEDCKEFQKRIVNEYFQAQVTERAPDLPDLLNCQDSILGLKLLDMRDPNKDICIAEWMVEKGWARKI